MIPLFLESSPKYIYKFEEILQSKGIIRYHRRPASSCVVGPIHLMFRKSCEVHGGYLNTFESRQSLNCAKFGFENEFTD